MLRQIMRENIQAYYQLAKPGIIYGNSLSVIAGFFLASQGDLSLKTFASVLLGAALVMGSGCVFNNYIDRGIDKKMARTKKRALVTQAIPVQHALIYATVLGLLGFLFLALGTNLLTVGVGAVGLFTYVVVYGIAKRTTVHGTIIGSIAGAIPPVSGYTAVTGSLDSGAWLLFLILTCWQMPHFYAIATYRREDYAAAGIPVLPVKKGIKQTKVQIVLYTLAFIIAASLLFFFDYVGYVYLIVMLAVGLWWLRLGIHGFQALDANKWARKVFGSSLIVLLVFCSVTSLDAWLP